MANHVQVRPFTNPSNGDILNAIRKNASTDYQRRIPNATKANVQAVLAGLTDDVRLWNEFSDALINQIGRIVVRNTVWTNPLSVFKIGMLEYGDTIEEVQIGLLEAQEYNPQRDYLEQDIFGQAKPDVQSQFHKIDRQNFYKLTVNQDLLRRAFTSSENGLSQFITGLMSTQTTSDQWDEFLLTASLFREYERNGGFFKVHVDELSASTSTDAEAKYALRRVRETAGNLKYLSTAYNAAGMPTFASEDKLVLFVTPEANAAMDVNALAGAFNMGKMEGPSRIIEIPRQYWGIPGAEMLLTTDDFFVIADNLLETTSQYNPVGLYNNYFLHHWEVVSASRFVPAVLFWTGEDTVIEDEITIVTDIETPTIQDSQGNTVTTVKRGSLYSIDVDAITTPAGGYNDAVRLVLDGDYSSHTTVTNSGYLNISYDERATAVKVNVYAVDDQNNPVLVKVLTANIVGDRLDLWPNPGVSPDADNNGLIEVTPDAVPAAPTSGSNKNKVKIPSVEGVDYKDGSTVVSGQTITLTANKTITAVAQTGYEITSGATASWNLVYTA